MANFGSSTRSDAMAPGRARRRLAPFLVVAAGLLATPLTAKETTLKQWADGPIRYIAEKEEMQIFKKLKSDADRAMFIERFWARRDPSPSSLTNEYRQIFWERVQETNRLFLDSHKLGSLTDRGKIYILYGPPTRVEDLPHLDTHSGATAGRGLLRWYYEGRPEGRMDLDPVVIVPFVRESTGEYRVSYDPKLSSVFFDALAVEEEWDRAIDRFLEIFGAPRETEMSVMLDLGRMQEVPPQAQVLLERVETFESYATHPIVVSITRYYHPDQAAMVAVVTTDVTHVPAGTPPAVIARFRSRDAQQPQRMLGEDAFRLATVDGHRVAQGRLVLRPGTYDVTVLVADTATAATGIHRGSFTIPEGSTRLRMSDAVWAAELSPLEYASMASHDEAYHVGPFRVVPSLRQAFTRGETLKLFFEVYGGDPPYDVVYQVEGQDLDGSWVRLGSPAVTTQSVAALGWDLATSEAWPEGEYRVRVDVEDNGKRLTSSQVPFRLSVAEPATVSDPPTVGGSAR